MFKSITQHSITVFYDKQKLYMTIQYDDYCVNYYKSTDNTWVYESKSSGLFTGFPWDL